MTRLIPVFYSPKQNAPPQGASPSAAKPKAVVLSWLDKWTEAIDVRNTFTPATAHGLRKVHDPRYVADVLSGAIDNGFGTKDMLVAASLPYTSGSMLAAAREALNSGVACSPTSGFHHAGYAFGQGFCTFNGLMVAAATLIHEKLVKKVGILDLDAHYGNGTADIIEQLSYDNQVFNYSHHRGIRPRGSDMVKEAVEQLRDWKVKEGVDLILYQAGADPHVNDPYGGFYDSETLRLRDLCVFKTCRDLNLPIAWNLAGGYQTDPKADPNNFAATIRPVLDIHDATMEECIAVYGAKS